MKRLPVLLRALLLATLPASASAQAMTLNLDDAPLLLDLPLLVMLGCTVWLLARGAWRTCCIALLAWIALIAVALLMVMMGSIPALALLVAAPWLGAVLMCHQCVVTPHRRDREPPPG
jgi:hypothetical protein